MLRRCVDWFLKYYRMYHRWAWTQTQWLERNVFVDVLVVVGWWLWLVSTLAGFMFRTVHFTE